MTQALFGAGQWAALAGSNPQAARLCRSLLLVPSAAPKMLEKARASQSDVIVFDLEDSVPAQDKEAARRNIAEARKAGAYAARHHAVKINGAETKWCVDDVAFLVQQGIDTIVLPTDRGWPEIQAVDRMLAGTDVRVIAALETPAGILSMPAIAQGAQHVVGLVLGPWDYTMSLGAYDMVTGLGAVGDEHLHHPRQLLLTQARAMGWLAIDAPFGIDMKNQAAMEAAARRSRRAGFDGCMTFYPPSIEVFNSAFSPSDQEVAWAGEVQHAYESREPGRTAVVAADGKTYLHHHYVAAKRLLRRAELCGNRAGA